MFNKYILSYDFYYFRLDQLIRLNLIVIIRYRFDDCNCNFSRNFVTQK